MRADLVNLAVFAERAEALLLPHVSAMDSITRRDFKYLGSAFMAPEVKADLEKAPSRWVIDVTIKTAVECFSYGGGEDDYMLGTASPSKAATEAAEKLAAEYGLYFKFEPCEKGWGSFYFEGKVS